MFFSATIHTPAASVYVNFSTAAKKERDLLPAMLLGGAIAAVMPLLAGVVGIATLAAYGANSGLRSYQAITQLAIDIGPVVGGVALAAILAAVISSGGPILLASSTMLVRDWTSLPKRLSSEQLTTAYRITTVIYGLVAALIAWQGEIRSILDLLLLGFAMVVPPAIALSYLLYWKPTREAGCFWGMVLGYGGGLLWWGAIQIYEAREIALAAEASSFERAAFWAFGDGGVDPSYPTTLIPLVAVPLISILAGGNEDEERKAAFYQRLATPS